MEKQLIISVGREYGSGGHEIAEKLANHYGIQLLDHNLLDEIAEKKNVKMDHLRTLDEKHKNPLSSRTVRGYSSSPEENMLYLQFDYLRDKADSGESFVIVGRCSETILKQYDCMVSIFILADRDKSVIFCGQFNTYLSFSLPAPAFSLNPTLPLYLLGTSRAMPMIHKR